MCFQQDQFLEFPGGSALKDVELSLLWLTRPGNEQVVGAARKKKKASSCPSPTTGSGASWGPSESSCLWAAAQACRLQGQYWVPALSLC